MKKKSASEDPQSRGDNGQNGTIHYLHCLQLQYGRVGNVAREDRPWSREPSVCPLGEESLKKNGKLWDKVPIGGGGV